MLPYYGYARQDRKDKPRVPITAKLVADLITAAGADRVLTLDLHAAQIQGFFNIPVDHLFAAPVILDYLVKHGPGRPGASSRPTPAASSARAPSPSGSTPGWPSSTSAATAPNVAEVMHIIGDVKGKDAIIVDDMIDTAGTLIQAVDALKREGARRILACGVHGVLSGPAIERIEESPARGAGRHEHDSARQRSKQLPKITVLSVAPLLAEAIRRIHDEESVSTLFV